MNESVRARLRISLAFAGAVAAFLLPAGALGWLSASAESLHHRAGISAMLSDSGSSLGSPGAEIRVARDEAILALYPVVGSRGRSAGALAAGVVLARLGEGAFPIELAIGPGGSALIARVPYGTPAYAANALEAAIAARTDGKPGTGIAESLLGPGAASRAVEEAIEVFVRACADAGLVELEDS
ncbi:MAG: hypothetical protein KBC36_06630 [Spirochaetia bacterium]|nr:hypothetical protein [Spirochaetia bacterium]